MTNRHFLVAFFVGLAVCGGARLAHAEAPGACATLTARVTVRLHNNAGVPPDVLTRAQAYARETYNRIGIALEWLDGRDTVHDGVRLLYTVVLMTLQEAQRKDIEARIADDVVGEALTVARRAYVYYDRVVDRAQPPERDVVTFLGYTIAHELGHLMLPDRRHSAAGIMRASLPSSSRSIETFTAVDAAEICTRLEREAQRMPVNRMC